MEITKEQRILTNVIQKAWSDDAFKSELLASDNPRALIEATAGERLDLPANVQVRVSDQGDSNYAYLNIPPRPNYDEMELSDEQLEMVAGGEMVVATTILIGLSAATLSYMVTKDATDNKKENSGPQETASN
ncbi:MAG: NHLP leader peptide family RiPP precursor [Bacteroidota bacterium]